MLIQGLVRLETVVEGKVGHFYLDGNTTIGVAKEMLFQFSLHIAEIEKQVAAQNKEKEAIEVPQPEVETCP